MSVHESSGNNPLTEPKVLAHTKQGLFTKDNEREQYAVVDTQFAKDEWLSGIEIDQTTREILSPFNHVRVGTGYPDLVGALHLDDEFAFGSYSHDDEPPLVVIEAKGYRGDKQIDLKTGVIQAYDRLSESNVAYLAAPSNAITPSIRSLARELNVGVLGVTADGNLTPLETPRLIGAQSSTAGSAIRFQATAQGVADQSFSLNHPKNYLAYPLAINHSESTRALIEEYVVKAPKAARDGAAFLGLVDKTPNEDQLTALGKEVVRFALSKYENVRIALQEFETWKRSRKRFIDIAPAWGQLTRWIVFSYPATTLLVEELQRLHEGGHGSSTLRQLVIHLYQQHPSFTIELFIRDDENARERVFATEDSLDRAVLTDGSVYQSSTTFQLKAILFHAGILTERGAEPHRIDPADDIWQLEYPL